MNYDRLSRWYDLLAGPFERPVSMKAIGMLGAIAGGRALEIGFGTGHGLIALARAVGEKGSVDGIDASAGMCHVALKRIARCGFSPRIQCTCADIRKADLGTATYDAIFAGFTLELFDDNDISAMLRKASDALKPGGRIAVVSVASHGGNTLIMGLYKWARTRFPSIIDCRPVDMSVLLSDSGLEIYTEIGTSLAGFSVGTHVAGKQ